MGRIGREKKRKKQDDEEEVGWIKRKRRFRTIGRERRSGVRRKK